MRGNPPPQTQTPGLRASPERRGPNTPTLQKQPSHTTEQCKHSGKPADCACAEEISGKMRGTTRATRADGKKRRVPARRYAMNSGSVRICSANSSSSNICAIMASSASVDGTASALGRRMAGASVFRSSSAALGVRDLTVVWSPNEMRSKSSRAGADLGANKQETGEGSLDVSEQSWKGLSPTRQCVRRGGSSCITIHHEQLFNCGVEIAACHTHTWEIMSDAVWPCGTRWPSLE